MDPKNSWTHHDGNVREEFPYVTKHMPVKEPFETACGDIGVLIPIPGSLNQSRGENRMVLWLYTGFTPLGHDGLDALEPENQFPHTAKDRCRPFKGTITMHLVPNEASIAHHQDLKRHGNEFL